MRRAGADGIPCEDYYSVQWDPALKQEREVAKTQREEKEAKSTEELALALDAAEKEEEEGEEEEEKDAGGGEGNPEGESDSDDDGEDDVIPEKTTVAPVKLKRRKQQTQWTAIKGNQ